MEFPVYVKYLLILLAIIVTFYVIEVAQPLLIPLSIAFVLSIILLPFTHRLEKTGLPRSIAAVIAILALIAGLSLLVFLLSLEIKNISSNLELIGQRISQLLNRMQTFIAENFGMDPKTQTAYVNESIDQLVNNSSAFFSRTLSVTTSAIANLVLIPLALFFMLYYRHFFRQFLLKALPQRRHSKAQLIIKNIKTVVQDYLVGIFTVMLIIAGLDTLALLLIGLEFALFWGVLAALLTIVPYIGVFIGSSLPIMFALVTKSSLWYPIAVLLSFWIIQIIEGNFITPNIVGDKVSLNPFAIILAIYVGGVLWGPAGMVLFIPFLAIVKVVFDQFDSLKPYGFLLSSPHQEHKRNLFRKWLQKLKP
ncbi:MAG: AI-2E family transporter [Candidatus Cyclobacteriaceae bacterium M3_2C_046]